MSPLHQPTELLAALRKRLQGRTFIRRRFPEETAHLSFQLIGITRHEDRTFRLKYAIPEEFGRTKAFDILRKVDIPFDKSIANEWLWNWVKRSVFERQERLFPIKSDIPLNSVENLRLLALGKKPGTKHPPGPAAFRKWRLKHYSSYDDSISYEKNTAVWLAEAEAAIDLDEELGRKLEEYKPRRSLKTIKFHYVPIIAFGLPACFLIISARQAKEPEAEFLIDVVTHEVEEFIRDRFTDQVIDAMAQRKSLKASVAFVVEAHFGWAKDFYASLRIETNEASIGGLTFYFPQCYHSTLVDTASQKLADLIDNLQKRIRSASIRIGKAHREQILAAISAQSLSHNIGSHALSDARLFTSNTETFKDGEGLKDFHQYLQGRLDYVAQLISKTAQPEPMYLWQDVLCEFFRQRLLLNRLVADRSVEGRNLKFKVSFPDDGSKPGNGKEITITWEQIENWLGVHGEEKARNGLESPGPDVLVAIPGGSVGRHALYSILENMMRNSVKYGGRKKQQKDLCIHFRLRDPDVIGGTAEKAHDYWLLEIWDNFSGFSPKDERFALLAKNFADDVIDEKGETRASGHGLIEIKEAMRFLHGHGYHKGQNEEGAPYACEPHCRRTSPAHDKQSCVVDDCHCKKDHCCHANLANVFEKEYGSEDETEDGVLVYRVRLRRPRMLGVLAPGCDFDEKKAENVTEGVFFRNGGLTARPDGAESLADLAPHLLAIRDDGTSDVKTLRGGIVREIAEQHWRLPFRLFVIVDKRKRLEVWRKAIDHWESKIPTSPEPIPYPFLPKNRVRILIASDLHSDLAKPQGDQGSGVSNLNLAFVNRVYDHWLMAFKPRPDYKVYEAADRRHLAVVFDRDEETVRTSWGGAALLENSALKSLSATAYVKSDGAEATPIIGNRSWKVDQDSVKRLIHFGNHGASPPGDRLVVDKAMASNGIGFSQAFGSSEGPRTFNMLYSPPQDADGFAFFCLTIVETALTEIAVFDERVFGVFFSDKAGSAQSADGKLLSDGRIHSAMLALLKPLLAAGSSNAPSGFAVGNIDWKRMKESADTNKPEDPSTECIAPSLGTGGRLLIEPVRKADVLVIHEGLIEELVGNRSFKKGAELCLFSVAPHIVRTSGKGRDARQLGAFLPFAEYSAISAALAPLAKTEKNETKETLRLEKISLARSILNTTGALPEKRNQS